MKTFVSCDFARCFIAQLAFQWNMSSASGKVCRCSWCCCYCDGYIDSHRGRECSNGGRDFEGTSCRKRRRDGQNCFHRGKYLSCRCCHLSGLDNLEENWIKLELRKVSVKKSWNIRIEDSVNFKVFSYFTYLQVKTAGSDLVAAQTRHRWYSRFPVILVWFCLLSPCRFPCRRLLISAELSSFLHVDFGTKLARLAPSGRCLSQALLLLCDKALLTCQKRL